MRPVGVILATGLVVLACDGDPTIPGGPVTDVSVAAPELAGLPGRSLQLDAVARNASGETVSAAEFAWASALPVRGTVSASGLVTFGVEPGEVAVSATERTSGIADTIVLRSAQEGELRWAVNLGLPLYISGGPTLAPDGSIWVMTRAWQDGDPVMFSELFKLSPLGEIVCQVNLRDTDEDYVVALPDGDGVWVTGKAVYRIGNACEIRRSITVEAPLPSLLSSALGPNQSLFAATAFHLIAFTPDLVERWRSPRSVRAGWVQPPAVTGERVYAKVSADSLYGFDATTGSVLWTAPEPDSGLSLDTFGHGPAIAAGRLFLPGRRSFVAYDTNGTKLWQTPPGGTGVSEPVILSDGRVVNQIQEALVARDLSGAELWRQPLGSPWWFGVIGGPALAEGGVVYAAARTGLVAVNAEGGAVLWRTEPVPGDSAWMAGSPAVAPDGTVYTWGATRVYAIFGSRPPDPTSPWPMWRRDPQRTGWVR